MSNRLINWFKLSSPYSFFPVAGRPVTRRLSNVVRNLHQQAQANRFDKEEHS
jgi:hypothetical protein